MAWAGNPENPVPNFSQLSKVIESEKKIEINRADQTRRDTDKQKDITISLIDVDTAIMKHLESLQMTVVDNGSNIKVPLYYASPEKWKSIQKDGGIRDYQGKMILPALVFKRVNSEKDAAMMSFNRYLNYPVMKKYSDKNKYTQFNLLIGQNVPINDVYDVVMPDHMVFTYHFIIWTEYVEQMNTVVERVNFETEDYWGDLNGFRFRTKIDSFSHTIDLQVDQDRMVKTEFDLIVYGYLLPDRNYGLGGKNKPTTQKRFTPKKVVMGVEVVGTDFDMNSLESANREKWRSQKYHNLPADEIIPQPPVVFTDLATKTEEIARTIQLLYVVIQSGASWHLPVPTSSDDSGSEGWISQDTDYYYIYTGGRWKRVPIALFNTPTEF